MIDLLGKKIAIVQCSDVSKVGIGGVFALETMKTVTIQSGSTTRVIPKVGTVFQIQDTGRVIVGDEMVGRLEDRLARGART